MPNTWINTVNHRFFFHRKHCIGIQKTQFQIKFQPLKVTFCACFLVYPYIFTTRRLIRVAMGRWLSLNVVVNRSISFAPLHDIINQLHPIKSIELYYREVSFVAQVGFNLMGKWVVEDSNPDSCPHAGCLF